MADRKAETANRKGAGENKKPQKFSLLNIRYRFKSFNSRTSG
jgi:hypothetical protein